MRSNVFYDNLAELCRKMYYNASDFKYFKLLEVVDDASGLYMALFKYNNEYIIAIRGTQFKSKQDLKADLELGKKQIPQQFKVLETYYKQLNFSPILVTGHSLGGSLAQMLANKYNLEAVTFEAYGTGDIIPPIHPNNIINYGHFRDFIFFCNIKNQVGKIKIMDVKRNLTFAHTGFGDPSTGVDLKTKSPFISHLLHYDSQ